jgi:beta-glucanase (GH16 family)
VHYAWFWNNNEYAEWNHGHKGAYVSFSSKEVPGAAPTFGGYPPQVNDTTAGSYTFHVYGLEWFTDRVEFSLDAQVYHIHYFNDGGVEGMGIVDNKDYDVVNIINGKRVMFSEYSHHFSEWRPFHHTFYIILSSGVGGSDTRTYGGAIVPGAQFPATAFIDWIRVYKKVQPAIN